MRLFGVRAAVGAVCGHNCRGPGARDNSHHIRLCLVVVAAVLGAVVVGGGAAARRDGLRRCILRSLSGSTRFFVKGILNYWLTNT